MKRTHDIFLEILSKFTLELCTTALSLCTPDSTRTLHPWCPLSHRAPGIIWFSFRRFRRPLTCQIPTLCYVFQSGLGVHCKCVVRHLYNQASAYIANALYNTCTIRPQHTLQTRCVRRLCNLASAYIANALCNNWTIWPVGLECCLLNNAECNVLQAV